MGWMGNSAIVSKLGVAITAVATTTLVTTTFVTAPGGIASAQAPPATANIVVTTTADLTNDDDGQCSLREAIVSANSNTSSGSLPGECTAGADSDTITLTNGGVYRVATPRLPTLLGEVTIEGNDSTIWPSSTLRVLQVDVNAVAEIRDVTLTHRFSTSGQTGRGLYNRGVTTLRNVTIVDNHEVGRGGGIYNGDDVGGEQAELTIIDSTIERNGTVPHSTDRSGGGIYNHENAVLVVTGSSIADNETASDGGGILSVGEATISASTISGNRAVGNGGGILTSGDMVVTNSTISGNFSDESGGGMNSRSTTTVRFTTVTDNEAPIGAGIWARGGNNDEIGVLASIVADNRGGGRDVRYGDLDGQIMSGGYNVVGTIDARATPLDGPGDVNGVTDPQLGPLSAVPGSITMSHRPEPTSAAVGRVPPSAAATGAGGVDQHGAPRGSANTFASAGAHECVCLAPLVEMRPKRIADSRDELTFDGLFRETGPRMGGTTWTIDVTLRVPSRFGATPKGAVLNVTALNAEAPGFATVFPCTDEVPFASSLNYTPGAVEPNEVIAKLSPEGRVCIFTQSTVDIVVDLVGWVPAASGYVPIDPVRFADSRNEPTLDGQFSNTGIRAGGTTWEIDVADRGPLPGAGIDAVAVNLTVTEGTGPGYATVYPCSDELPTASSINYGLGITRPNELVTKLSPTGTLCVFVLTDVHVIVDVVGYLDDPAYVAVDPVRVADSRDEPTIDTQFRDTGLRGAGTEWKIQIAGRAGLPTELLRSVMVNVTVTEGVAPGFVTVYGCGPLPRPGTSSLNHDVGTTRLNELLVTVGRDGAICVYTQSPTHVIVDVVGYNATRASQLG